MPNHIANVVTISGEKQDLQNLIQKVKGEEKSFSLASFFPMPTEETDAYHWNIKNWGTKWDVYQVSQIFETDVIQFSFQTAWSTPSFALMKLSKLFPNTAITCEFADDDMGYNVGLYTIQNGMIIEENFPDFGSPQAYQLSEQTFEKAAKLLHISKKQAIKINVETQKIEIVEIGSPQDIYFQIGNGCRLFQIPYQFENQDELFCDEESLLNPDLIKGGFIMLNEEWKVPIVGNAIILGSTEEGDMSGCKSEISFFEQNVKFLSAETCQDYAKSGVGFKIIEL